MTDNVHIWNVNEDIIIELFIASPSTGNGLSGQKNFTVVTITRGSDGKYWTGLAWSSTRTELTPIEPDATNQPGRYNITLPGSTGNINANRYLVHANVSNPPTVEGDSFEVHVSREQDVRVYESEPV